MRQILNHSGYLKVPRVPLVNAGSAKVTRGSPRSLKDVATEKPVNRSRCSPESNAGERKDLDNALHGLLEKQFFPEPIFAESSTCLQPVATCTIKLEAREPENRMPISPS